MVKNVQVKSKEDKSVRRMSWPKRLAVLFSILWLFGVVAPAVYFVYNNAPAVRNYAVVTGVYEANKALLDQYDDISANLIKKLDVNKYVEKIKIPEIKLDKVSDTTGKVGKTATVLSAFGVKGADKVADKSNALQAQVDKINSEIKSKTEMLTKTLAQDFNNAIKTELSGLGKKQLQKQLQLSDVGYTNLLNDKYGIVTESGRKVSASIYAELAKNTHHMVRKIMDSITTYYMYVVWGVLALIIIIGLIPVAVVLGFGAAFTKNFVKCPYCGRVLVGKEK